MRWNGFFVVFFKSKYTSRKSNRLKIFNNSNDTHSNTLKWINENWIEQNVFIYIQSQSQPGKLQNKRIWSIFFISMDIYESWIHTVHLIWWINARNLHLNAFYLEFLFENMLSKRKHHWFNFINRIMFTFLNLCFGFCFSISRNARFQEQQNLLSK